MSIDEIKNLMRDGDLESAESALRTLLARTPDATEVKVLLGTCCHLLGKEEEFRQIEEDVSRASEATGDSQVGKFHALKTAASVAALVLAAGTTWANTYQTLYGISTPLPLYGISCSAYTAHVTFDADGGTGTMAAKDVTVNTCKTSYYTLPTCTFKKSGYDFDGWTVANACYEADETVYSAGSKIDLNMYADPWDCANVIVQAVWREAMTPQRDWLLVSSDGDVETEVSEAVDEELSSRFTISSGSVATITVSGLPTGVTYDKTAKTLKGKTSKKGVYYVTCSAKNKNGFTMSDTIRWIVGGASEGDYDNIGFGLGNLAVGDRVCQCELPDMTIVGLPPGLKYPGENICGVCCPGPYLSGVPTKAGKYVVRMTEKATGLKTQQTVIVRDSGSAYLNVGIGSGYTSRGIVTGSGVRKTGATVNITAKPAKGCLFAGWYTNEKCTEKFSGGKSGDYRTANESFVMTADTTHLYAKFVTRNEDSEVLIDAEDVWTVATADSTDSYSFDVISETQAKVVAKGLPNGVTLSGTTLKIPAMHKMKPGSWTVMLTAKNLSGATDAKEMRLVIPNLTSYVFDDLEYDGTAYSFTVGESDSCKAVPSFSVSEGWSVTASGLPSGLKFNFDRENGCIWLSGMAKKAGTYTVSLHAKNGKEAELATFTVEVAPFPIDAIGTYGGVIGYELGDDESEEYADVGYCIGNVDGTFSVTVAKDGKISAKFTVEGKSVNLSGYSCSVSEEAISVDFSDTKGNWCDLILSPQSSLGAYQVSGSFGTGDGEWSVLGQRNVAKTDAQMKTMVSRLSKLGKIQGVVEWNSIACPLCIESELGSTVSPDITFTVGSDGMVKSAGKIEGRSVSGSAILQVLKTDDDHLLYADFYDYKSSGGRASSGKLTYRAVFSWNVLSDMATQISAKTALCDGSYYIESSSAVCKSVIYLYPETETECSVKVNLDGK